MLLPDLSPSLNVSFRFNLYLDLLISNRPFINNIIDVSFSYGFSLDLGFLVSSCVFLDLDYNFYFYSCIRFSISINLDFSFWLSTYLDLLISKRLFVDLDYQLRLPVQLEP